MGKYVIGEKTWEVRGRKLVFIFGNQIVYKDLIK